MTSRVRVRRAWRLSLVFALAGAVLPRSAAAVSFDLVSASREVYAEFQTTCPGCGPGDSSAESSLHVGQFDGYVETLSGNGNWAAQTSSITAYGLSGSGSAVTVATGGSGTGQSRSVLSARFGVYATLDVAMTGTLSGDRFTAVYLYDVTTAQLVLDLTGSREIDEQLQLEAGHVYTLSASTYSWSGITPAWSFALVAVPEPGGIALALVGLGVGGGALRRRRGRAVRTRSSVP